MDWGLFDGKHFLREQLIYPKKVWCAYAVIYVFHTSTVTFSSMLRLTIVVYPYCSIYPANLMYLQVAQFLAKPSSVLFICWYMHTLVPYKNTTNVYTSHIYSSIVYTIIFCYQQSYYVLAIFEDLIFRSLWTLNISVGESDILPHRLVLTSVLAVMEVFRYALWCYWCNYLSSY